MNVELRSSPPPASEQPGRPIFGPPPFIKPRPLEIYSNETGSEQLSEAQRRQKELHAKLEKLRRDGDCAVEILHAVVAIVHPDNPNLAEAIVNKAPGITHGITQNAERLAEFIQTLDDSPAYSETPPKSSQNP